jgi:hypothetical protein
MRIGRCLSLGSLPARRTAEADRSSGVQIRRLCPLSVGCAHAVRSREEGGRGRVAAGLRNSTGGELTEVIGEHHQFYGNVIVSFTATKSG